MDRLPAELVLKVFQGCEDVSSVINLSKTSKRYQTILNGAKKLEILFAAAEIGFAPLDEAIQLVTYNESQAANEYRDPAMSMSLIKQLAKVGNIANEWLNAYPALRWRSNTDSRRLLRPHEVLRFRRALYRFWLYGKAFHSINYLARNEPPPMATVTDDRLKFLRRFNYSELAELCDLNGVFYEMLYNDICPSNAMIKSRYIQAAPGQEILIFGNYETFRVYENNDHPTLADFSIMDLPKSLAKEAWGSRDVQISIVHDCLKLNPDELLHFRELEGKFARKHYLNQLNPLFQNNASTFRHAVEAVFAERDIIFEGSLFADGGILDYSNKDDSDGEDSDGEDSDDEDCDYDTDLDVDLGEQSDMDFDEGSDMDLDEGSDIDLKVNSDEEEFYYNPDPTDTF